MGISGLLPLLKSIQKPCNLKAFAGQTLGVDAYGWLHRGTVACAIELAQGKPTTKFVDYAMNRVRMLIHFGVKPYIVFDGDYLPSKSGTEKDRAARRRESKKSGLELLRMGKTAAAHMELQKAVDVTPEMARQLIDELRKAKVDFVVAPYEADAQMAYLEKKGIIDGILSEDSDLLVFGTKTLVTKLDQYGDCIVIRRDDFTSCKEVSFVGWTDAEFRWMAILSGCDYLPGIEKMGLKTAHRFLKKHKTVERLVRAIQFDGKMKVSPGYMEEFKKAEEAFLYQWAFCPTTRELVNLNEPEEGIDVHQLSHIGKHVDRDIARKVAQGYIHPHTKELLVAPAVAQKDSRSPLSRAIHQTPELKKHHSIESFFKPRRTPLAELDPNTFTPSPSQQRLLEQQQQVSWSAEPTQLRPVISRALTEITRSQPARRAGSDSWSGLGLNSSKRQRLCSDNSLALAMGGSTNAMSATSKFFGPKTLESPSMRKSSRNKEHSQEKINIWSDDSIEEAMSQIPDIPIEEMASQTKSKKKMAVFCDEPVPVDAQADSQTTTTTGTSASFGASFGSNESQSQVTSQDVRDSAFLTETSFADLKDRFTFGTRDLEKVTDRVPEEASIPCSSPPPQAAEIISHVEAPRIGPETEDFTDEEWTAAATAPVKPLPLSVELGALASITHTEHLPKGSEDELVPESEGEAEAEEDHGRRPSFGINLGQFAFSG